MSNQVYFDEMIKNIIQTNKNFERKTDQHLENIETTQRIVIEKVGGIRSLIELNYKEIIKNRKEILENRKYIIINNNDILENRKYIKDLSKKLDKIFEKLDQI